MKPRVLPLRCARALQTSPDVARVVCHQNAVSGLPPLEWMRLILSIEEQREQVARVSHRD